MTNEVEWWTSEGPQPGRLMRYQLAALEGAALLRVETTAPGDLEALNADRMTVQIAMLPAQCRRIAEHLIQCADLLERHKKPLQ